MYVNLDSYLGFFLVMMRITGMLIFNPILGRRNVPARVQAGLALFISLALYPSINIPVLPDPTLLNFVWYVAMELAIGAIAGLIIQMFLSVLLIGGDLIDTNIGISMSKVFDPGMNTQASLTTNLLNILFVLIFFITNNHYTLLHITMQTFGMIPVGTASVSPDIFYYIPELMSSIFIYGIKLSLPILILEVVMTMGVGIIMRVVPQINVFVVNIQLKLMVGLFTLFVLIPTFTGFVENLITICFERLGEAFILLAG